MMLTAVTITFYVGFQVIMDTIKVFHCRSTQFPLKSPHWEKGQVLLTLRNMPSLLLTCLTQYVSWTTHNEDCKGRKPTGQLPAKSFPTAA